MRRSRAAIPAAIIVAVILVDQLSKAWVRAALDVGESIRVLGPLSLTRVENTGSVFGIGQGYILIPTAASIVVLVLIPIALRHLRLRYGYIPSRIEAACIALIAGGAIGNLIDRVVLSCVTDFIDVELLPGVHWPFFNFADSCIVVGTIVLLPILFKRGTFVAADGPDD